MDIFEELGSLVRGLASTGTQKPTTGTERRPSSGRAPSRAQQVRTQQAHQTQRQTQGGGHQRQQHSNSTHHQAIDASRQQQRGVQRPSSSSGVDALVSMGFPREVALGAWHKSGGDMVRAVEAAIAASPPRRDNPQRPLSEQASPPQKIRDASPPRKVLDASPPRRVASSPPLARERSSVDGRDHGMRLLPFDQRQSSREGAEGGALGATAAGGTTTTTSLTAHVAATATSASETDSSSRPVSASTASPPSSWARSHIDPQHLGNTSPDAAESLAPLSAADFWSQTPPRPHSWHFGLGLAATERHLEELQGSGKQASPPLPMLGGLAPIVTAEARLPSTSTSTAPTSSSRPSWEAPEAPRQGTPQKTDLGARHRDAPGEMLPAPSLSPTSRQGAVQAQPQQHDGEEAEAHGTLARTPSRVLALSNLMEPDSTLSPAPKNLTILEAPPPPPSAPQPPPPGHSQEGGSASSSSSHQQGGVPSILPSAPARPPRGRIRNAKRTEVPSDEGGDKVTKASDQGVGHQGYDGMEEQEEGADGGRGGGHVKTQQVGGGGVGGVRDLDVKIVSGGSNKQLAVFADPPEAAKQLPEAISWKGPPHEGLGMHVVRKEGGKGVVISQMRKGGAAALAEPYLKVGDKIISINGKPTRTVADVTKHAAGPEGTSVLLHCSRTVSRGRDQSRFVSLICLVRGRPGLHTVKLYSKAKTRGGEVGAGDDDDVVIPSVLPADESSAEPPALPFPPSVSDSGGSSFELLVEGGEVERQPAEAEVEGGRREVEEGWLLHPPVQERGGGMGASSARDARDAALGQLTSAVLMDLEAACLNQRGDGALAEAVGGVGGGGGVKKKAPEPPMHTRGRIRGLQEGVDDDDTSSPKLHAEKERAEVTANASAGSTEGTQSSNGGQGEQEEDAWGEGESMQEDVPSQHASPQRLTPPRVHHQPPLDHHHSQGSATSISHPEKASPPYHIRPPYHHREDASYRDPGDLTSRLKASNAHPDHHSSIPPHLQQEAVSSTSSSGRRRSLHDDSVAYSELELMWPPMGTGSEKTVYQAFWRGGVAAAALLREGDGGTELHVLRMLPKHPHLPTFFGVSKDPKGCTWLVTEFFPLGGLDTQLEVWEGLLSVEVKFCIAQQIREGIGKLNSLGIVHRDVASRNVLVHSLHAENTADVWVKVTDFGSAEMGNQRWVEGGGGFDGLEGVPWRWVSPEVDAEGRWGEKSDVWAFGVTMWEVYTDAQIPYCEISDDAVLRKQVFEEGLRLKKPEQCPDWIYRIMRECWDHDVRRRPTFEQLRKRFGRAGSKWQYQVPSCKVQQDFGDGATTYLL